MEDAYVGSVSQNIKSQRVILSVVIILSLTLVLLSLSDLLFYLVSIW
jgi:hypothetical protein